MEEGFWFHHHQRTAHSKGRSRAENSWVGSSRSFCFVSRSPAFKRSWLFDPAQSPWQAKLYTKLGLIREYEESPSMYTHKQQERNTQCRFTSCIPECKRESEHGLWLRYGYVTFSSQQTVIIRAGLRPIGPV